jgi:uncharacterized protein (TIGR00369 family)
MTPEGFEVLPEGLGFSDVLRPLYRRVTEQGLEMGMYVQPRHTNLLNICHGGVLMTLADLSAAAAVNHARKELAGAPTINLSFDFISAAREGDWLQARCDRVSVKRLFGFSSGVICSGDRLILRFSGTFYLPDHGGFSGDAQGLAALLGQG